MALAIKNNLVWVGKKDGDLQHFHGLDYPTNEGFSHNSYLIKEQKSALIDTVWSPYAQQYVDDLARVIALDQLNYIVVNHTEVDRSGALPALMEAIPDTPIYCTTNGAESLKGHYHKDWNFQIVRTGDTLDLGNDKQLVFLETPMLHWPDSMMSYLTGDGILFSNDIFGQNYSSKQIFNDLVDPEALYHESMKYYANTLTPFNRVVTDKIQELLDSELEVKMICPANGVVWRDHPSQIINRYLKWANNYRENQITMVFDTLRNSTREMAQAIAEGIEQADASVAFRYFDLSEANSEEVLTQIFRSKGLLVGSPTVNVGMMPRVAALIESISGLRFTNKRAAAFGSYGWSGEAVDKISERLAEAGFIIDSGLQISWKPTPEALQECQKFGRDIAKLWHLDEQELSVPSSQGDPTKEIQTDASTPYKCWACGWVYDPAKGLPEQGIPPGTPWEEVPDDMQCPVCFLNKSGFDPIDATEAAGRIQDSSDMWD